ncbi:hypothetical protein ACTFIZ_011653 [Dictyostelium cf. discoideum]
MPQKKLIGLIPKIIFNDNYESKLIINGSSLKTMSNEDKNDLSIKLIRINEIIEEIILTINKDITNHFNLIQENREQLENVTKDLLIIKNDNEKENEKNQILKNSSIKIKELESQKSDFQNKIKELYIIKTQKEDNKLELLSLKTKCTSMVDCIKSNNEFLESINLTYIEEVIKVL